MGLGHLYFNPTGRINRSTFWLKGFLLLNVIWIAIWIGMFAIAILQARNSVNLPYRMEFIDSIPYLIEHMVFNLDEYVWLILFAVALWFVEFWTFFAVMVKRLHDRDKSAWWLLLWWGVSAIGGPFTFGLVSLAIGIWMFIELGCLAGTPGPNRYGYYNYSGRTNQPMTHQPGHPASGYARPQTTAGRTGIRTKICPYCGRSVMYEAIKCIHCRADISPGQGASRQTRPVTQPPSQRAPAQPQARAYPQAPSAAPTPQQPVRARTYPQAPSATPAPQQPVRARTYQQTPPATPTPQQPTPQPPPMQPASVAQPTPQPAPAQTTTETGESFTKPCPSCDNTVERDALVCGYCGADI